jgi:hypothetical protein
MSRLKKERNHNITGMTEEGKTLWLSEFPNKWVDVDSRSKSLVYDSDTVDNLITLLESENPNLVMIGSFPTDLTWVVGKAG